MQSVVRRVVFTRGVIPWCQPFRRNVNLAAQPLAEQTFDWDHAKPYSEIPGPKPLPLLGNAWRFMPGIGTIPIHDFKLWMDDMYEKYGPISKITNIPGKRDMVFVFEPQDFEIVYRNEGVWPERLAFDCFPYYRNVLRKDVFGDVGGILSENGEKWQTFRTFVNPVMMQPRNSKLYAKRIDNVSNDFMKLIPSMLDEKQELPDTFTKEVQKWALESISLVALDTRLGCLEPNLAADSEPYKMINAVDEALHLMMKLDGGIPLWKYISTPSWKRFVIAMDTFTDVCIKHINNTQEKLKNGSVHDENEMSVLEKLLLKDQDSKKAVVMAMDMMMAGIDTTSFTVACVLYHLAHNPEVQQRLFEEVYKALPEKDSPITADVLESMKYLKACVRENNRMNPVAVGTGRRLPVDIVLSNYRIPKDTDVLLCHILTSNSKDNFSDPKKFIPERWLKEPQPGCPMHKSDVQTHPYTSLPFGFGKRNCVGMRFAKLEIETLIARMIRNYRLEWHYDEMTFKCTAIYEPNDPMKLRLFAR